MKDRYALLQRGLFPEVLPPCFTSVDLKRAFRGSVPAIREKELHKRPTDYIRYSGTKHDGSRRYFATPNPISYFYVADFVSRHWEDFENRFRSSPFSVSTPKVASTTDDRPIVIPSLSELTTEASKRLRYSPFILRTDVAQFFHSIYTHSIPWSAHGIEACKEDRDPASKSNYFNRLDVLVQNCQRGETRGVLIGPDAFRLIAEYVIAGIDAEIQSAAASDLVGGARHVDDYFLGLRSEPAAIAVLSTVRDKLQRFNLQINDTKTKVLTGLDPLNELWALELRQKARSLSEWGIHEKEDAIVFVNKALTVASSIKSDSPVKIALRTLDQIRAYRTALWSDAEPYLQRIIYHHPHCIDYVALLVTKRVAIGEEIDEAGWQSASHELLRRHLAFNHHHEIVWLLWLLIACKIEVPPDLVGELANNENAHIRSLLIAAWREGRIDTRPALGLGAKLATTDANWLTNIVARVAEYSKAPFSGDLTAEFDHLARKRVKLIDFDAHTKAMAVSRVKAISRTRYGYDSDDDPEIPVDDDEDWPF